MASIVELIVPQPCFDEFFVKFNFFHVACLKIVLSKCLGFGIIAGSLLVKVPQIMKILTARSAKGLSISSCTLELVALSGSLSYSYANSFPFSTYGESAFIIIQTTVIAYLVLLYTRGTMHSVVYTSIYVAILAILLSPLAPMSLLWALQASGIPCVVSARLIQAVTNYRNSSTGQLSAVTVFLLFLGSVARIFTSIQETGDITIIAVFVVGTICNGVLVAQLLYYWKSVTKVD